MEQISNIESILRKIQHDRNVIGKSAELMKFADERGFRPGLRVLRNLQEDLNGFHKKMTNMVQFGFKVVVELLARIIEAIRGIKLNKAASTSVLTMASVSAPKANESKFFDNLKNLFSKINSFRKLLLSPIVSIKDKAMEKAAAIKEKLKKLGEEKIEPKLGFFTGIADDAIESFKYRAHKSLSAILDKTSKFSKNKFHAVFDIVDKSKTKVQLINKRLAAIKNKIDIPVVIAAGTAIKIIQNVSEQLGKLGKTVARPIIAVKNIASKAVSFGGSVAKSGLSVAGAALNLIGIDPKQSIQKVLESDSSKSAKYAVSINNSLSSIRESFNKPINSFIRKVLIQLEPLLKSFASWLGKNQATINAWSDKGSKAVGMFIGLFVKQWPRLQKSLEGVWNSIRPIFLMLLNIMSKVISWVIANIPTFAAIFDKVFPVIHRVITVVINILGKLWKAWVSMWPVISSILQTAWSIAEPILNVLLTVIELLGQVFEAVFPTIVDVVTSVWNQIKPIFDAIGTGIAAVGNALGSVKNFLFGTGDKNINVNGKVDGKHAAGLPYVPFDGYIAELHKGERVLTASESKSYNSLGTASNTVSAPKSGNTFNISINGVNKSTNEIMNELVARIREAAGTMGEVAYCG